MYNPQELQRRAQLNLHGVDTQARTTIETNPPKEENNTNGGVRFLATIGNIANNIVQGAVKSLEGIVDAGAMLVGLFGADVNDFVEYDFTSDVFGTDEEGEGLLDWAWGRNLADVSYLDNDHIVNQIAEGVGGMLPTIALAVATGGTSLAGTAAATGAKAVSVGAKVANIASKVAFIGGAVGNASETALKEGADYWQALGYGAVSGAIEGATEMIGGRMFGATSGEAVGKTLLGRTKGVQKLVNKSWGKALYNFTSEGVEEVISDVLDPLNKRMFGITDAIEIPSLKDLGKTFVIGGTIGQILDGAQTGVRALKNSKNGGKHYVNMSNNLQDIVNTHKALAVIQGNTKVSQERMNSAIVRSSERTLNDLEDMSNELKAMNSEQRENALKILGDNSPYIREMFENDGTLKDDTYATYNEIIKEGGKGYNVSTNLMYSKEYLDKKMQEVSAERGETIEVSTTNLNEKQRKNFAKITRSADMVGKKTNQKLGVVLVKQDANSNTTLDFISGDTIYINERHLENGEWASYLAHEITHFAKDSKEFKGFAEFALKDKSAVANALSKIASNYDFSLVDVENLRKKIGTDQKMTDTELEIYDELIAHLSEELFTSEKSIELLARENTTLAQKILNKIKDFLSLFKGTNANRETVQRLRKAELLLENALKSIGKETESIERNTIKATKNYLKDKKEYESLEDSEKEKWLKERGYKKEDFDKDVYGENNETIDKNEETRYSKKGYAYRNPNSVNEKDFNHHYWAIAYELLSKEEIGVLDSAIGKIKSGNYYSKNADGFYMIPVGENGVLNKIVFTDGNYERYSIDTIIEINSKDENTLSIERENIYVGEYKGIQTQTNELLKVHYSKNYRFSEFRAESESNLRNSNGKQDGTRSDGKTKYSIKDSNGRTLTKEQQEYFKDSKVRDEDGNLLVVYHATNNYEEKETWNEQRRSFDIERTPFTIFKKQYDEQFGHFFGKNINNAGGYGNRIYSVYLNIKNPLIIDCKGANYSYIKFNGEARDTYEWAEYAYKKGYDGVIFKNVRDGVDYGALQEPTDEYVAFRSNQIKNIDNKNPTYSADIRYSIKPIEKPTKSSDIRYSIKLNDNVETEVTKTYGKTYNWSETGYILNDGTRLDLSGKNQGASGGRRTIDHRDIFDSYEDIDGTDAMIAFMARGNIRVSPEYPGINIQVEPNAEQYRLIQDLVERLGWKEKYFSVDFDNKYGEVVETLSYEGNVSGRKVVSDIKYYFKEGKIPYQSELSKFRYSVKINADMTDSERYEILKDKKIENIPVAKELTKDQLDNIQSITSFEDLNKYFGAEKRSIIKKIASEFGVFKEYYNKDIELEFEFSKSNYNESYQKQKHNFVSYAKMFSVFDAVVEKAVGIEVHNRNIKNYKEDQTLKNVYVLASAFIDDQSIVPVKLEIKEFNDKNNKLYVAIALDKIKKTEVLEDRAFLDKEVTHSSLSVNISIRDLLRNVNPNDKDFYKYIPKQFFEEKNRYSIKPNENTRQVSEGQIQKKLADISKKKVYSKKEAQEIVSSIIGDVELGGGNYIRVTNKNQEMIADELWKVLNTYDSGKRVGVSEKIADYIIDSAIMHNVYDEEINDASIETVAILRKYLHRINLNSIKGEIKYRYDNDNSPYAMWSNKKGIEPDELADLLKEDGIFLESINGADMFFEMDSLYRKAVKDLKTKKTKFLNEALDEGERAEIRKEIRNEILKAFATNGSKSKLAKIIETYSRKAKVWKDLYYEEKTRNNNINSLLNEIKNLKGLKEFKNATQYKSEQFKGSIEKLEKLDWRGNLNESGARNIVANLNAWYNRNNKIIGDRFDTEVSETLSEIASGEGKLNSTEIRNLANVVTYFRHFIETSTKIYRQGKWVDAKPIAEDYVAKMKASDNIKFGPIGSVLEKVMGGKYVENFSDPMALARYMDKYEDGFYTNTVQSFREGAIGSAGLEMELRKTADEFFRKNKKYLKDLQNKFITYRGVEIPLGKAISLYMTLNRDQAILGLAKAGFKFENLKTKKTIEVKGFEVRDDLTFDEYKEIAREVQTEIGKQLTETDLKLIKIVENAFEKCKKYKYDRDMQLRGYSNVIEGYYFPIRRIAIAERIDRDYFNGDRVSNQSFNKSIVKGAQQALFIDSIENIFVRHVRGIAQYYHLAPVIENYDIINNLDIGGNVNAPISVASTSVNVWKNGSDYLKKMFADVQGVKNGDGGKLFSFLRTGFAKYQLGANPKVWFSQLASLFASTSILDYGSIIKGFGMKTADVDKYCMLAEYRNNDNVAVKSQGVIDEIGKIGDVLTKPIGFTDRLVIRALFGACQVQVQKENGLKIGSEENKVKAGELLAKVILETQQNNMATERSKAMRSSSELMKTVTMFTSDAMKVLGRVVDSFGRVSVIKARLRIATDAKETERLKSELKSAHKDARRSTTALIMQASFMTLLTQLFKKFYNKDDEEEQVKDIALDFVGNMIGGMPILKDFASKLTDGYDVNNYATSSINDLFEAIGSLDKVADGDSRERASSIRKILYATGQIFGIPVRNLYNVFYGTANLISPEFAYKMDDMFYKQSYRKDLKKAIENEDYDMISTIAGLITKEDVGVFSGNTREEIARLLANGQDVLPTSIGNTMTINETQYTLDGSQKETFKSVYSGAITSIDKLISTQGYKVASDEAKAKAIKYVYRYYYYMAQQKALGVEIDSKLFLFGEIISIEKLALALAEVPLLVENSKNKKQVVERYLQASKLSVLEKYMLMGYFGYKTTKGESMIKSAINRSSLSKEQKNKLLEKCGLKKEQV